MKGVKDFSINKKSNGWLKILIGAVVLSLFLFVVNIFVLPIKNSFYTISSPIEKTFWTAGESSSGFLASLLSAGSFSEENQNLKIENQKLLSQVASLQSILQGNQAQSDVSATCQNSGFKLVMAGVIGLDEDDVLSINKGSANGLSEGMPVISQQGVLFGKISKVYKNFSKVMLVSNKNSIVNVKVSPFGGSPEGGQQSFTPEIDGVVKGSGGLGAYLDLIPISSEINPQDVLVTSTIEKSFPKDLLVARIIQKEKNDQKPFQKAQISLFFDIKAVDNLFVVTNYKR